MAVTETSNRPGEPQAAPGSATERKTWVRIAALAAAFLLIVCATMVLFHLRGRAEDPLKSTQLTALKEQLAGDPKNEALKEKIRALDLQVRGRYFQQVNLNRAGAWLALGGLALLLVSAKRVHTLVRPPPMPQPNPDLAGQRARARAWSRLSVVVVGALCVAACVSVAIGARSVLPARPGDVARMFEQGASGGSAASDFASAEEMERNWPQFRGARGSGVTTATNLPVSWDANSGAGIAWKTEVPAPGFNSPIVWGERVYLSGADTTNRVVMCFDARTGAVLWQRPVQAVSAGAAAMPEIPEQTGFAASTMATDGRRVYAIFANGDLAAFTLDGKPAWSKNLGIPKNPHGHASSLATWDGRLVVQLDQGDTGRGNSKLYAFEGATGRVVWQRNRAVPASWSTPLVIRLAGKAQVIALGVPWAIGYAVQDGVELWRVEGLNNEVTPSPALAGNLVLVVSPNEKLMAVRPDGQGDVTKTHVAWESEDNVPDISSPAATADWVFTLTTPGMLTCYGAKDGKKQWEKDFEMECNASPTVAGSRLYLAAADGVVVVTEVGPAFKEIARSNLGEKVFASPAFVDGRIFFRGAKHLFCVQDKETKLARSE